MDGCFKFLAIIVCLIFIIILGPPVLQMIGSIKVGEGPDGYEIQDVISTEMKLLTGEEDAD